MLSPFDWQQDTDQERLLNMRSDLVHMLDDGEHNGATSYQADMILDQLDMMQDKLLRVGHETLLIPATLELLPFSLQLV